MTAQSPEAGAPDAVAPAYLALADTLQQLSAEVRTELQRQAGRAADMEDQRDDMGREVTELQQSVADAYGEAIGAVRRWQMERESKHRLYGTLTEEVAAELSALAVHLDTLDES